MLNFFSWLGEIITMAWQYFINFINSIVSFTNVLVGAVALPQSLPGLTFGLLGSSVIIVSAIAVIKILAGR